MNDDNENAGSPAQEQSPDTPATGASAPEPSAPEAPAAEVQVASEPEPAGAAAAERPPERHRTLLEEADDPEPAPGSDDAEAAADAGKAEALAKFTGSIKALDLGDGVRFDDDAFNSIAPELMEVSGGDPAKAEPLVRKFVQGEIARQRAAQEAQDAFNQELRNQCRQRWGADTRKVARDANRGGLAVFGEKIWNEMKGIESFANNPDIMERLAIVGRRFAEDGGAVHPAGQAAEDTRDVISRMYGGIK